MGLTAHDPHHDGSPLYVGGDPSLGRTLPVRVRVPRLADGSPGATTVVLRSVRDGEPLVVPAHQDSEDDGGSWWSVDLMVSNPLTSYRFLVSAGRDDYRWLNAAGVHARDVTDAGDFKVSTEHHLPAWVPDQVGYQVFPDRFERADAPAFLPPWAKPAAWDDPVVHRGPEVPSQVYGGTLDGVTARLGHLEELGATLLYLTPVFEARSNHRYDGASFDHVDPLLGGDEALRRLIAAAHDRGIRVVGDLTTNHTGNHHPWFTSAMAAPDAREREFYYIHGDEYVGWLGVPTLPKLNHASAELARRLHDGPDSVVARWLREGLDGWRIDVANMTGRHGADDFAHEVARTTRRTIASVRADGWLLAEHGHDASLDLRGDGWHGTMDYAGFTRPVWCWLNGGSPTGPGRLHGLDYLGLPVDVPVLPGTSAVATMREVHAAMPWGAWQSSTMHLDSHDTPRFRTVTGGGTDGWIDAAGLGRERHLLGVALQFTMPGVPVVFMGDEIGLTGVDGEHARTPYPWTRREEWDAPTLAAYRTWMALRRDHVALRRGGMRWLHVGADSMTFLREHPDQTVLVHVARAGHEPVVLPRAQVGAALDVLTGEPLRVDGDTVVLPRSPGAHVYAG